MHTIRLIYASDARAGLSYRDVRGIQEVAAALNPAVGITGMLCYGSGHFLQALEGEREAVNTLYHHIETDSRHTNCSLMLVEDITTRDFGEWSMKVIDWTDAATAAVRKTQSAENDGESFNPRAMSGLDAANLLRQFAVAQRALTE